MAEEWLSYHWLLHSSSLFFFKQSLGWNSFHILTSREVALTTRKILAHPEKSFREGFFENLLLPEIRSSPKSSPKRVQQWVNYPDRIIQLVFFENMYLVLLDIRSGPNRQYASTMREILKSDYAILSNWRKIVKNTDFRQNLLSTYFLNSDFRPRIKVSKFRPDSCSYQYLQHMKNHPSFTINCDHQSRSREILNKSYSYAFWTEVCCPPTQILKYC